MSLTRTCTLILVLLGLAACQNDATPTNSSSSNGPASTAQTTAAASSAVISVMPATMSSCKSTVATVRWDADKLSVGATGTEVWIGTSGDNLKLFAAGGVKGEIKTGNWTTPGLHFELRNKHNGKVLGEATVAGPACP